MDSQEELDENAWLDHMGARQAALEAAVGHFIALNVPTAYLKVINQQTTDGIVQFAAQIVLHQRGEPWRPEPVAVAVATKK